MKILQVVPKMNIGGVERGVVDLVRYAKDHEHEIVVVSGPGALIKDITECGAKHYTLNVYKKSLVAFFLARKLRKIINKEKIDIVHARSRVPGWISFLATRNGDVDFITTAHGTYSVHFLSEVMGWGKFVICPSRVVAKHMRDAFGVPTEKLVIINRWVDLNNFKFVPYRERIQTQQQEAPLTVLALGRLSPSKGYEYLIDAMRRIVRSNPYVTLKIVGSYDESKSKYFNKLKNLINRYSLNYNVQFLGFQKDVQSLLAQSHVLVVPSVVEESFGRVIVEAMAAGVPVVASKIGAFPEIIEDQKDGILVPPRDPEAIAKAVLELLSDPQCAMRLVEAAREKITMRYSSLECIGQLMQLYEKTRAMKRILVIKISSLGDLILAVPSFKALKERFPHSEVVLVTLKKYAAIMHECPYFDKVVPLDDDFKKRRPFFANARYLRRFSFDYIVDLQNSTASHLLAFLSFGRKSYGYGRKLGFLLTHTARMCKDPIDPLASQQKVLSLLGVTIKETSLSLWPLKQVPLNEFGLNQKDCFIGINVAASIKRKTKNWPLEHLGKCIQLIAKEFPNAKIVLLGDKESIERGGVLEAALKTKVLNLCGKTTIKELMHILSCMRVFITPDSAPLHLSVALGTATIGLFGPTDYRRHTVAARHLFIISKHLDCSYCYKNTCTHLSCMHMIAPEEVFAKVKEIVKKP